MDTQFAIKKAGSRQALAELLGIDHMTTYQPSWHNGLPPKHDRYLRVLKPEWFREWEREVRRSRRIEKAR